MSSRTKLLSVVGTVAMMLAVGPQLSGAAEPEPGRAVVSLYRVAPGKHLDFLKWFAAREAIDKEAGVPATQWYAHVNGDAWDFIAIGPDLSDEQDAKLDELSKKKGLSTGFKAALEFRQYIGSHTDTFVRGPMSAAQLVQAAASN